MKSQAPYPGHRFRHRRQGFLGSIIGLGLDIFLAVPMLHMFAQGLGGIPLDRFTLPPSVVVYIAVLMAGLGVINTIGQP